VLPARANVRCGRGPLPRRGARAGGGATRARALRARARKVREDALLVPGLGRSAVALLDVAHRYIIAHAAARCSAAHSPSLRTRSVRGGWKSLPDGGEALAWET